MVAVQGKKLVCCVLFISCVLVILSWIFSMFPMFRLFVGECS